MEAESEGRSLRSQDLNSEKNCINHDQIGNVWHTSGLLEKGWIKKYGYKGRGRDMLGEFVISWVLSHHNKILKQRTSVTALGRTSVTPLRWTSVTAQFYLESKGKYILQAWGHANPKDAKRREAPAQFWLPFLHVFFPPPPGPAVCKLG